MKQVIVGRREVAGKRYGGVNQRSLTVDERSSTDEDEDRLTKVAEKKKQEKRAPAPETIKWIPVKRKKYFFLDCEKALVLLMTKKGECSVLQEKLYHEFAMGLRVIMGGEKLVAPTKFNVIASGYILSAREEGGFVKVVRDDWVAALPNGLYHMCESAMSNIFPLPRKVVYR